MSAGPGSPQGLHRAFRHLPPELNSHVAAAVSHLHEWTERHGLIGTTTARERFDRADFGSFAAATYPTADQRGLCLIADWFAWLFLLDDQLDDGVLGKDPLRTGELMSQIFEVLTGDGAALPARAPSIVTSLADLWQRTEASPRWRARFVDHVITGGLAARWEADNRARGTIPDVPSYVENRRHTGAIYVCMDLIEVVEGIDLPPDVYDSEPFARALRAACDVVCWTNDVYSLDKETALGEYHNLVTVVRHAHALTTDQAVDRVTALITDEVDAFTRWEEEALRALPGHTGLLEPYFAGMRSWMRGNFDWSARTRRYRDAADAGPETVDYLELALVDGASGSPGEQR
ncbi:terpene synthase family protein [Streptomyces massasporeus]|uniref:terpene synthase family protein n=1 Tax=Streptomyces massasporeus TaxID=67324 RepID=UPI00371C1A91